MLIIGNEEVSNKQVAVRHRLLGNQGAVKLDEFINKLKNEENEKINPNLEVSH